MTRSKSTSLLLAGAASLFALFPISGGGAQEVSDDTLAVTLDGVSVDGATYSSVTITSEAPLNVQFGDAIDAQTCARGPIAQSSAHFGRNGQLTPREFEMAKTAWSYFETSYQSETGLVNAVGSYPSTTLWDTASYISAMVAAYELCVIDKREFDNRATRLIETLRNLPLYRGEAPNKVYNAATGEMVESKKGGWDMKNMPRKGLLSGALMSTAQCRLRH